MRVKNATFIVLGTLVVLAGSIFGATLFLRPRPVEPPIDPNVTIREPVFLANGMIGRHMDLVPLSTGNLKDIDRWNETSDPYTHDELRLSRKIIALPSGTGVKVLSLTKGVAKVEVKEGVHAGERGLVSQSVLFTTIDNGKVVPAVSQSVP